MRKGVLTFILISFFVNVFAQSLNFHAEDSHLSYSSSEQCIHSESLAYESNKTGSEDSEESSHCEIHCHFHHCHCLLSAVALRIQFPEYKSQYLASFNESHKSRYLDSIFRPPIS